MQWDIMHEAFGGGGATLVLIGDPKQAIYAFRGADVHAYLQASRSSSAVGMDARRELAQRRGSCSEAYDALFGDAQLGYAGHRLPARSRRPPPNVSAAARRGAR